MRLEDLQKNEKLSWYISLFCCVLGAAVLLGLGIALLPAFQIRAISLPWIFICLLFIAYMAEMLRYQWHCLQETTHFQALPSKSDLRILNARRNLYRSVLGAIFALGVSCSFIWEIYSIPNLSSSLKHFLWIVSFALLIVAAGINVPMARNRLRQASSAGSILHLD